MSGKEKEILETFSKVIPKLSELEKEKLHAFGEGMAFKAQEQELDEEKKNEGMFQKENEGSVENAI